MGASFPKPLAPSLQFSSMYLSRPHNQSVFVPTFYVDRVVFDREPGILNFGVLLPNGSVVRFEPELSVGEDPSETTTIGVMLTSRILSCMSEEVSAIRGIYSQYADAIQAYFDLCVYQPCYPTTHDALSLVLTFDLTNNERNAIETELERFTCIYLIRDRATGLVKIGQSRNPYARLKQLQKQDTLMPTSNDFVIEFYCRYYAYVEKGFHRKYETKRVRGEWFNLTEQDVSDIREEMETYTHRSVVYPTDEA